MPIELKKVNNKDKQRIQRRQVILQHVAAFPIWTQILESLTMDDKTWTIDGSSIGLANGKHGKRFLMRYKATRSEAVFLIQQHSDEEGANIYPGLFLWIVNVGMTCSPQSLMAYCADGRYGRGRERREAIYFGRYFTKLVTQDVLCSERRRTT